MDYCLKYLSVLITTMLKAPRKTLVHSMCRWESVSGSDSKSSQISSTARLCFSIFKKSVQKKYSVKQMEPFVSLFVHQLHAERNTASKGNPSANSGSAGYFLFPQSALSTWLIFKSQYYLWLKGNLLFPHI